MKFNKKKYQAKIRECAAKLRLHPHQEAALAYMLDQPENQTLLQAQLIQQYACAEACLWVGNKTAREAWNTCEHLSWMYYLANSYGVPAHLVYGLSSLDGPLDTPNIMRQRLPFELLREYSSKY